MLIHTLAGMLKYQEIVPVVIQELREPKFSSGSRILGIKNDAPNALVGLSGRHKFVLQEKEGNEKWQKDGWSDCGLRRI